MSGGSVSTERTAVAPSAAVRVAYPSEVRTSSSIARTSELSSTTRTRPVGAPPTPTATAAAGTGSAGLGTGAGGGPASAATRVAADTGFAKTPAAPARVAWRCSSLSIAPVTTSARIPGLNAWIRLRASTPPSRGIIRSSTTASGRSRFTQSRASSPFAAWSTSKPASRNDSTSTSRTSASSSAISTRMNAPSWSEPERVEAGDVPADDEGMDVVRALVGVDGLQIHHVADHRMLVDDAGGAQDVTGQPRRVERDLHVVHLGHRNLLRAHLLQIFQSAELQAQELRLGDLGDHPDELLLHELERRDRLAELDALLRVLERPIVAAHRGADGAPRDAVARLVETAQRAAQALHVRKLVRERNLAVLEGELGGDRGAHRELAVDVERRESRRAPLDQVAVDLAVVLLRPHHRDVGDRAVGDPELRAVEDVAVALALRPRLHPARVGAVVGLGETETAHLLAARHRGQPPVLLRLGAIGVDRVHHQAALHRRPRAQPGVAALELLHDQPVGNVAEPRAAVALERGAEHTELAELRDELDRKRAGTMVIGDQREELRLHPVADRVADHPVFFGQEALDRVVVDAS